MTAPISQEAVACRPGILAAISLCLLSLGQSGLQAEPGTWTSDDGRTVAAELVEYDSGKLMVRFRKANGREFKFPMRSLIAADQARVKKFYVSEIELTPQRIDQLIQQRLQQPHPDQPYFTTLQAMTARTPETDTEFLQRVSTAIIGRAPTAPELATFSDTDAPGKRHTVIDDLLDSDDFVVHFSNQFLAELLQIDGRRPAAVAYAACTEATGTGMRKMRESIAGRRSNPQPSRYREWVEQQVRNDAPWDELVTQLLTASGPYTENPAAGYLIVNSREPFLTVNPAPLMAAFAGIEITCAQCHDHPVEAVYQMDFFKLAAYFGSLEIKMHDSHTTPSKFDFELSDSTPAGVRLPLDYAYDDGNAGGFISPGAYFGKQAKADSPAMRRQVFADWLTDESNPRFTLNIANRLAAHVFGHAPVQPVDNLPGDLAEEGHDLDLANSLAELIQQKGYRLREFLRVLYHTTTFAGDPPPQPDNVR